MRALSWLCAVAVIASATAAPGISETIPSTSAPVPTAVPDPDHCLAAVVAYADTMLEHGRDRYGARHSPLFSEALDRATLRAPEGDALKRIAAIPHEEWGVRASDRMLNAANPQHCQNLYQILYALTAITGDPRYARQANESLAYFLHTCQSPKTGLFYWGEHAGWDLFADAPMAGRHADIHEFYRPWALWGQSWKLAAEPCRRFAEGLWRHQIGDHKTGAYSRHAAISAHGPGTNAPYARHGGFFLETWAKAYAESRDDQFLRAIEIVLSGLEKARLTDGGYLVSGTLESGGRRAYDLSLAVSLEHAAAGLPPPLAARLRAVAAANDEAFIANYRPVGCPERNPADLWRNAYGGGPSAASANLWMLRYRQNGNPVLREAVLREAECYRGRDIALDQPLWPGTVGQVIWLMLDARELSGEQGYLQEADRLAQRGRELFLWDGPLPRATHRHEHYEAVTNGDTLMMALLRLWMTRHRPDLVPRLIYTDR